MSLLIEEMHSRQRQEQLLREVERYRLVGELKTQRRGRFNAIRLWMGQLTMVLGQRLKLQEQVS